MASQQRRGGHPTRLEGRTAPSLECPAFEGHGWIALLGVLLFQEGFRGTSRPWVYLSVTLWAVLHPAGTRA